MAPGNRSTITRATSESTVREQHRLDCRLPRGCQRERSRADVSRDSKHHHEEDTHHERRKRRKRKCAEGARFLNARIAGADRTTTTTIIPDSKKPGLIAIEMRKVVLGARPRRNVDRDSMDRELETGGGPPSPSPRVHARVAFAFHPRPRTPSTTPAGRARRRSRQSPPSVWILESTRRMTVSQPFLARPSLAPPATDGQSASLSRRRTWGKEWGKGRGRRRTEPGDLWDRNR